MADKYDFSKGRPTRPPQRSTSPGGSNSNPTSKRPAPPQGSPTNRPPVNRNPVDRNPQKRPVRSNVDINKSTSNTPKKKRPSFFSTTNTFTRVIMVLFVVFVIYGIGVSVSLFSKSNLETMSLRSIDITKNDTYPAIVIRDEVVYTAKSNGYVGLVAKDLEKIKKGSLMFTISESNETTLSDQLTQIEDDIFNLQSFREEYSNYSKDIDAVQGELKKLIENFNYDNYNDINLLTDQLNDLLDTRKQIIFADQRIIDSSKVDTKQILESQIDANSAKFYSDNGGIVAYTFDGLEDTVTPDAMKAFTLDQTKMDSSFKAHDKVEVATGDTVIRVIESNTWYLGTYIGQKEADGLKVGDNKTLFINVDGSFKELPARVKYVSDTVDKNVYIIFESLAYMQQYMNKRNLDIALKSNTYMNMKIPTTAIVYKEYLQIPTSYLRETDQIVAIKQLEDGTTSTIPIVVEETNSTNNFSYIDKEKNDLLVGSIIINPADATQTYLIPEVKKIPGVYKVNNGFADFVKVEINQNIVSDSTSTDFVYILPSANLKEYDRILIHSNTVAEGDIIE